MYDIDSLPGLIELGHLNEKGVCEIEFDVTDWLEAYPLGVLSITYIRPGETTVYPADGLSVGTVDDADILTWTVSNAVTAIAGSGSVVITLTEGETIVKRSDKVQTIVMDGHAAAGDPPDPVADWIAGATSKLADVDHFIGETIDATESANAAAGLTNDAIDRANAISEMMEGIEPKWAAVDISASGLAAGAAPTASVTQDVGGTHLTVGIPKGDKGDKGDQGDQGIQGDKGDKGDQGIQGVKGDPGDISNIKVDGATKTKAAGVVDLTSDFARYALWRKTASGNPVSMYPVPESPLYPKVSGMFVQEGTGDPSPSNIRPITPWLASGASTSIKRTGKNLLQSGGDVSYSSNGIVITKNANGSLTINGTSTGAVFYNINQLYPITLPPGNYYQTTGNADVKISTRYVTPNILINSGSGAFSVSVEQSVPCYSFLTIAAGRTFDNVIVYPQIELGSTATAYEPYSGQEIALTAPQEIPAGWMDNEGNGQVTWGKRVFDGTESGLTYVSGTFPYYALTVGSAGVVVDNVGSCSHFKRAYVAGGTPGDNIYNVINSSGFNDARISFRPTIDGITDLATVKTWLAAQYAAGTPMTVYYQLATPVPLTPTIAPLTALPQLDRVTPRQNVLTASTGNMELTYAKSPIRDSDDIAAAIAAL